MFKVEFTPREKEIYEHLMLGETNGEIANSLIIESCTVATHVASILQKKVCSSKRELMAERIKELEHTIRDMRR